MATAALETAASLTVPKANPSSHGAAPWQRISVAAVGSGRGSAPVLQDGRVGSLRRLPAESLVVFGLVKSQPAATRPCHRRPLLGVQASAATPSSSTAETEAAQAAEAVGDKGAEEKKASFFSDVGEVEKVLGSRVVDGKREYLIEWSDDHPDSWEPEENVARGIIEDYETPWWAAARKADEEQLKKLLESGRDPNAIDNNERTALIFAAGIGNVKVVNLLLEAGANVHWQDKDGYSALHIAAGYVHSSVVQALLEAGADPELEDKQQRSSLVLARQLLEKTPANNPFAYAKRIALDQVVKMLDEAVFEEVEVEQILDKRIGEGGVIEYLVRWSDGSEDSWEPTENIGEDLVRDFLEGLEYGVVEKILEKRSVSAEEVVASGGEGESAGKKSKRKGAEKMRVEYLVKWADSDEPTWEPLENLAADVVAKFEGVEVEEIERRLEEVEAQKGQ